MGKKNAPLVIKQSILEDKSQVGPGGYSALGEPNVPSEYD